MEKTKTRLSSIEEKISNVFNILWRLGVFILLVFLIIVVWKDVKKEGIVFHPFEMPKKFEDGGFDGGVFAKRIFDEIESIKESARSQKTDSVQFNANERPDLQMDVLGFGLSSNSLSYYIKDLFGYESQIITGELTDLDKELKLSLRLPDQEQYIVEYSYANNTAKSGLDTIIQRAAEKIISDTDPYRLAIYLYHNGRNAEAKKLLQRIIEEKPHERKWAYLAWGHIYRADEEFDLAEDMYRNSFRADTNFALANMQLGWYAFRKKDYKKSIYHFAKCPYESVNSFQTINGLAYANMNLQDYESTEKYLRLNVKHNPKNYQAYANLSRFILQFEKDTSESFDIMRKAVALNRESLTGLAAMGDLHRRMEQFDSAIYYADRILEIEPKNLTAIGAYADFYYTHKEDFPEANKYYHKMIAIYKQWDGDALQGCYNMIAMSHYKNNALDSSILYANLAIAQEPAAGYPYSTLAEAYYYSGDMRNFYINIRKAVERGFPVQNFMDEEPYVNLKDDIEMTDLLATFKD